MRDAVSNIAANGSADDHTRWALASATTRLGVAAWGTAMLGTVAAVALSMTTDRERLEAACCHGTLASNQAVIRIGRAERAVCRARAWKAAKDESTSALVQTGDMAEVARTVDGRRPRRWDPINCAAR